MKPEGSIVRNIIIATTALLALSACAQRQQGMMTWAPKGTPTMPQEQALAECRYDIVRDARNFEQLFIMSGQPAVRSDGAVQGLNQNGIGLFQLCMSAKGYAAAGMVPVQQ